MLLPFGCGRPATVGRRIPCGLELRRRIAFIAPRSDHVLIVGRERHRQRARGSGHPRSARRGSKVPSWRATPSTFPEGLVDAEPFGHAHHAPTRAARTSRVWWAKLPAPRCSWTRSPNCRRRCRLTFCAFSIVGNTSNSVKASCASPTFRLIAATNGPGRLREDFAARLKLYARDSDAQRASGGRAATRRPFAAEDRGVQSRA